MLGFIPSFGFFISYFRLGPHSFSSISRSHADLFGPTDRPALQLFSNKTNLTRQFTRPDLGREDGLTRRVFLDYVWIFFNCRTHTIRTLDRLE